MDTIETRENVINYLVDKLDWKWPTSINDAPKIPGWNWHDTGNMDRMYLVRSGEHSITIFRGDVEEERVRRFKLSNNIETLIKSWLELRDEANRLREQLTAAEQVERDAHAQVEASLAAMGWGEVKKSYERFELVNEIPHESFEVGDIVELIGIESDSIHLYRNTRNDARWFIKPEDLRKL